MAGKEVPIGSKLSQSSIPEISLQIPMPAALPQLPSVLSATIIQRVGETDSSENLSHGGSSGGRISISRSRSRTTSIGGRSSSKSLSRLSASWVDWRKSFINTIFNFFRRVFSFPLVNEPISFTKPNTSADDKNSGPGLTANEVEELCNYDAATRELFDAILQGRKETMDAKDRYHYQHVDIKKFPGWDETIIERLKSTFQVFDITGDGLVDFDEMTAVLAEFGDKTPEEVRKRHFDVVDIDGSGAIDFEEFLMMIYSLTMQKDDNIDSESAQFGESYRMIDRNMSRIRSLDVVQQLQAGLF